MVTMVNMKNLNARLVGGYVRDMLLKQYHPEVYGDLEPKDKDWVVVGETPESMVKRGFKPVGSAFPVFIHPVTKDEYALARRERKTGPGHKGFECDWEGVTFEEDARRRDCRINSIQYDPVTGKVYDYCGGVKNIIEKKIDVIDPKAFVEDPLRVLRVGQLWARFPDFCITEETFLVSQSCMMVEGLEGISSERIWNETHKALSAKKPSHFFIWAFKVRALEQLLPELVALMGQTQSPKYHREGDSWIHTMQVVDLAAKHGPRVAWAALLHDLGKGLTAKELLPKHHGHEQAGIPLVTAVCERLKVPKDYKVLAEMVCEYHLKGHKIEDMLFSSKPGKVVRFMETLSGGFKKEGAERARECFLAFKADAQGRKMLPSEELPEYPQFELMNEILDLLLKVKMQELLHLKEEKQLSWDKMHVQLHDLRVKRLKEFRDMKREEEFELYLNEREDDSPSDEEIEAIPYPHGEGDREHLDEMTPEYLQEPPF